MKKQPIISLLLYLCSTWYVYSQQSKLSNFPIHVGNRWGYTTEKGDTVSLIYREAHPFWENRAKVRLRGQYGFINTYGETVIPMIYDRVNYFIEGKAVVCQNGKYGYMDTNGVMTIPMVYDYVESFIDGRAVTQKGDTSEVIDATGKILCKGKGEYATLNWPYVTIFSDVSENKTKCYTIHIPTKTRYENVEFYREISSDYYLFAHSAYTFSIRNVNGKEIVPPTPIMLNGDFAVEGKGYLVIVPDNKIGFYPTRFFLYSPAGKLVKEVRSAPKTFFDFEYEPSTYVYLVSMRPQEGGVDKPNVEPRYFYVDTLGSLIPKLDNIARATQREKEYSSLAHAEGLDIKYGIPFFSFKPGKDSIFAPLIEDNPWLKIESAAESDFAAAAALNRVSNKVLSRPFIAFVDTVTESNSGDNFYKIYFKNNSSKPGFIYQRVGVELLNPLGKWVAINDEQQSYRCDVSAPKNVPIGAGQYAVAKFPIFNGVFKTRMRLIIDGVYTNTFPASVNPFQFYR